MEANSSKVLHPSWDKKHRLPHQTPEAIFDEAFASWEFEVNRYERKNKVTIPDSIKIAILLNETKGALQQHLQLTASSTTSAPKQTEDKGITTQEEETPAIVNQQPMKEEATSSKKQKVTITEGTPAHPTTAPTSFAPSMTPAGAPVGSPTSRRTLDDSITEGSTAKQQKTTTEQQAAQRPEASPEPPRTKGRINAVTVQMKNRQKVTTQHVKIRQNQRQSKDYWNPSSKIHKDLIRRS